jgi:hypothetical protein
MVKKYFPNETKFSLSHNALNRIRLNVHVINSMET